MTFTMTVDTIESDWEKILDRFDRLFDGAADRQTVKDNEQFFSQTATVRGVLCRRTSDYNHTLGKQRGHNVTIYEIALATGKLKITEIGTAGIIECDANDAIAEFKLVFA